MTEISGNDYRYERKFFISDLIIDELEMIIRFHPAMFSEVYPQRYINNIYFDSADLDSYFSNLDGSLERSKHRIRWYGKLFGFIEKPVLEIKNKIGLLGRKDTFRLSPFKICNKLDINMISNMFNESNLPEKLNEKLNYFNLTLLNRYSRKYFQSADNNYRITVDSDLAFYQINNYNNLFVNKIVNHNNLIVELKYSRRLDNDANHISKHFPFRMTKSSKYVHGVDVLSHF